MVVLLYVFFCFGFWCQQCQCHLARGYPILVDWAFYRGKIIKPKPPKGYNVNDFNNASQNYFDPYLNDGNMTNPDANDDIRFYEWYDFMISRVIDSMTNPHQPWPFLLVGAPSTLSNRWILPYVKCVLHAWESNTSTWNVVPNNIDINAYSLDVCGDHKCVEAASVQLTVQTAFARQRGRTSVPSFQTVVMDNTNEKHVFMSIMLSGLAAVAYEGRSPKTATDQQFFQNFVRTANSAFEQYFQAVHIVHAWGFRSMVIYKCGYQINKDFVVQLIPALNEPFMFVSAAMYIKTGAPTRQAPTMDWITQQILNEPVVFQASLHCFFGESQSTKSCRSFEYFHYSYPWVIGRGFLWVATHLRFELEYKVYLASIRQRSTTAEQLLANGVPVDGFVDVVSMSSNGFDNFKSWIEINQASCLEPISNAPRDRAAKLFNAIWGLALQASKTHTRALFNFTTTNFALEQRYQNFMGLDGIVSFNPTTGDVYVRRILRSLLRSHSHCKPRIQERCRVLQYCVDVDTCNLESLWANCMSDQPSWNGNLLTHDVGFLKDDRIYQNLTSTVSEIHVVTRYHNCETEQPSPTGVRACNRTGRYYDPNLNACVECPLGKFTSTVETRVCMGCPKGTFANVVGLSRCSACDPGYFSNLTGLSQCFACPSGRQASANGMKECVPCSLGYFAAAQNSSLCMGCGRGRYQNQSGATQCFRCDDSYETDGEGSILPSECKCPEKTFDNDGFCANCASEFGEESVVCLGGLSIPILNSDYMTLSGSTVVYYCHFAPEVCKGGKEIGEFSCSDGSSGIACGFCANDGDQKRVRTTSGVCEKCPQHGELTLILLVSVGLVGLLVKLRPKSVGYNELFVTKELTAIFVIVPILQLLDFGQLCSIFPRMSLNWPSSNRTTFGSMAQIFDLSFANLPCILGGSDKNSSARRIIVLNIMPLVLIVLVFCLCLPGILIQKLQRFKFTPNIYVGVNLILSLLQTFFITILNFSITLVFAVYKHPASAGSSLLVFPHLLSDSREARLMQGIAWCALSVWCGGTFMSFALAIGLRIYKPHWTRFQRCTLAVAIKYDAKWNGWVLEEMSAKFWSVLIPVVFVSPTEQLQWMVILLSTHVALLAWAWPYRYVRHSMSDLILSTSECLMVLVQVGTLAGDNSDATPCMVIMFFGPACASMFLISVFYAVFVLKKCKPTEDAQMVRTIQSRIQKICARPDPYFSCLNDANSHIGTFESVDSMYSMVIVRKQQLENKEDAALTRCMPASHRAMYAELRSLQRDSLLFTALGDRARAKETLNKQRAFLETNIWA